VKSAARPQPSSASKLYQIITDKRASDHTGSIGVEHADASAVEAAPRDTLTPDDLVAKWRAPPGAVTAN